MNDVEVGLFLYGFLSTLWLVICVVNYVDNRDRAAARLLLSFALWPLLLVGVAVWWVLRHGLREFGKLWGVAMRRG